jgi:hypothetical protein
MQMRKRNMMPTSFRQALCNPNISYRLGYINNSLALLQIMRPPNFIVPLFRLVCPDERMQMKVCQVERYMVKYCRYYDGIQYLRKACGEVAEIREDNNSRHYDISMLYVHSNIWFQR